MALEPKDLGGAERAFASSLRLFPKDNKVITFAIVAGDPLYPIGTPLAETAAGGTYVIWNEVGEALGRKLSCFVISSAHQASSTGETQGVAMTRGDLHRDDIPLPAGELQADLDNAMKDADFKSRGFDVQGLAGVSL